MDLVPHLSFPISRTSVKNTQKCLVSGLGALKFSQLHSRGLELFCNTVLNVHSLVTHATHFPRLHHCWAYFYQHHTVLITVNFNVFT